MLEDRRREEYFTRYIEGRMLVERERYFIVYRGVRSRGVDTLDASDLPIEHQLCVDQEKSQDIILIQRYRHLSLSRCAIKSALNRGHECLSS